MNNLRLTNLAANDYPYEAKRSIQAAISSLKTLVQRDPEQEIQGIALAVADAAIEAVKAAKPDHPIVQSTAYIYSADQIGSGDPVRAADLLFVAEQLDAALGPEPIGGFA
ncbi:MAG TPA: hypothetical protein VI036_12395 [Propionibacteriaceae bacterium]